MIGHAFRSLLAFLDERDLREAVLARVPPEAAETMQNPPWMLAWVDSFAVDELERALGEIAGPPMLVELGLYLARGQGRKLVQPLLHTALSLLGQTPASVYGRLDWLYSLTVKGLELAWLPGTGSAGIVELRCAGPSVPEAAYHVVEGTLRFVLELCDRPGEVDRFELVSATPSGSVVRFAVRWQ